LIISKIARAIPEAYRMKTKTLKLSQRTRKQILKLFRYQRCREKLHNKIVK